MAIVECREQGRIYSHELEQKRRTVIGVREVDPSNLDQVKPYFNLLRNPTNKAHFTDISAMFAEFAEELKNPKVHPLVGINQLGEEIGYATLIDARRQQNDHGIIHVVVNNALQSRTKSNPSRVGSQLLERVVEWAFATPTDDGRERIKLYGSVVEGVPNWERGRRLFLGRGFKYIGTLPDQSDVTLRNGELVRKPSMRFELLRSDWEKRRIV